MTIQLNAPILLGSAVWTAVFSWWLIKSLPPKRGIVTEDITALVNVEEMPGGKFTIKCATCQEPILENLNSGRQAMFSMPAALEHYKEKHPSPNAAS